MRTLYLSLAVTLLAPLATAQADLISPTNQNSGTIWTVDMVENFTTGGDMSQPGNMDGMQIYAIYADNTVSSAANWNSAAGGASGFGFSLTQSGDTFTDAWTLTVNSGTSLRGLIIDAKRGDVVFDVVTSDVEPTPSTVNSSQGRSISLTGGVNGNGGWAGGDVTATYSTAIKLAADAAPVGDLFGTLRLDFSADMVGMQSLSFFADTDNVVNAVPEPSSFALSGLLCLGACVRRRRRAA